MTSLNQKLMKNSLFLTSNLFCGQKWNKSVVIKKWGKVGAYPTYTVYVFNYGKLLGFIRSEDIRLCDANSS